MLRLNKTILENCKLNAGNTLYEDGCFCIKGSILRSLGFKEEEFLYKGDRNRPDSFYWKYLGYVNAPWHSKFKLTFRNKYPKISGILNRFEKALISCRGYKIYKDRLLPNLIKALEESGEVIFYENSDFIPEEIKEICKV